MQLILLPTSDQVWNQFEGFYRYRNITPPPRPPDGIWVAQEDGLLLGGVCLYPCAGAPYVLVENIATRIGIHPRLLWTAMQAGVAHLVSYATARSMQLVCFPTDPSLGKLLERAGFVQQPSVVYTMMPGGMRVGEYLPKLKQAPEPESTRGVAETAEEPAPAMVAEEEAPVKPRKKRAATCKHETFGTSDLNPLTDLVTLTCNECGSKAYVTKEALDDAGAARGGIEWGKA